MYARVDDFLYGVCVCVHGSIRDEAAFVLLQAFGDVLCEVRDYRRLGYTVSMVATGISDDNACT